MGPCRPAALPEARAALDDLYIHDDESDFALEEPRGGPGATSADLFDELLKLGEPSRQPGPPSHHRDPEAEAEEARNRRARNKRVRQERRRAGDAWDGAGGVPGFQTAKAQLVDELRRAGEAVQAAAIEQQNSGRDGGAKGPGAGRFVPPLAKRLQQGAAAGHGGGGGGEEGEGALSSRTLELLGVAPGEPLPEQLAKLDARLVESICQEAVMQGGDVSWDDIAGQEEAKRLIQEVIVWPMLNPTIFQGVRAPPKGVLLFGPPGTGKTLLGRAVAANIKAAFFSISASSLTSKWIGEGEKLVRTLFAVARWLSPSVIFIDEVDSILSARRAEGEHEASRRLKTELLVQMEGCDPASSTARVLLIGATNRPEELDEAARRRMPKQLYIPLPCDAARRAMVERALRGVRSSLTTDELGRLVARTAGYSGSDMRGLVAEACAGPVREAVAGAAVGTGRGDGADPGSSIAALSEADLRPVCLKDFQVAARSQRASVKPGEVERYERYNAQHGARLGTGAEADDDEDEW